jgi:hypothetical protein
MASKAIQQETQAGPYTVASLTGKMNQMANIASHSFHIVDDTSFLSHFDLSFPLPQQQFWKIVHLMLEQISNMILMLGGKQLPLPWCTIPYAQKTGKAGSSSAHTPAVIPTCNRPQRVSNKTYSLVSLHGPAWLLWPWT